MSGGLSLVAGTNDGSAAFFPLHEHSSTTSTDAHQGGTASAAGTRRTGATLATPVVALHGAHTEVVRSVRCFSGAQVRTFSEFPAGAYAHSYAHPVGTDLAERLCTSVWDADVDLLPYIVANPALMSTLPWCQPRFDANAPAVSLALMPAPLLMSTCFPQAGLCIYFWHAAGVDILPFIVVETPSPCLLPTIRSAPSASPGGRMVGYACGPWTRQTAMTEATVSGAETGLTSRQRHSRGHSNSSSSRVNREAGRWTVTMAAAGEVVAAGNLGE